MIYNGTKVVVHVSYFVCIIVCLSLFASCIRLLSDATFLSHEGHPTFHQWNGIMNRRGMDHSRCHGSCMLA